jgi:uncharacterized protein YbaA (DUF1428 family)
MAYVDGFLIPVPTKNLAAYKKMSQKAGVVWMDHGALDYKECAGDDLNTEGMGTRTSFPKALKIKSNETVVFSWITYASKADRTRILKAVMADPRLADMIAGKNSPFDPKKMLYAGFDVMVDMAPNVAPRRAKAVKRKSATKKKARR